MGYLIGKILQGIVWVVLTIIQGFLGWIDLCDAVLTTFVVWLLMCVCFDWNGWWALALGLAVSLLAYIIFKHRIGFWLISVVYSLAWGLLFPTLTQIFFFKDMSKPVFWVFAIVVAALSLWQHSDTRYRKEILAELAAEEAAKAKL